MMKNKLNTLVRKVPNLLEERDVLGQIKNKSLSLIKRVNNRSVSSPVLNLNLTYASLVDRIGAFVLDLVVVSIVLFVINQLFVTIQPDFNNVMIRIIIGIVTWVLYCSIFESSRYQATIGKIMLQLKVTDLYGKRIKISKAILRCLSTVISISPAGLGIWSITSDPKKQAWHDLISETYVIKA